MITRRDQIEIKDNQQIVTNVLLMEKVFLSQRKERRKKEEKLEEQKIGFCIFAAQANDSFRKFRNRLS